MRKRQTKLAEKKGPILFMKENTNLPISIGKDTQPPYYCMISCFSCAHLFETMDCTLPGPSLHGIFPAKILEWVAMHSSKGSSQPKDQTCIFCVSWIAGGFFAVEPSGKPSLSLRKCKLSQNKILLYDHQNG